jgi:hypothetical protein
MRIACRPQFLLPIRAGRAFGPFASPLKLGGKNRIDLDNFAFLAIMGMPFSIPGFLRDSFLPPIVRWIDRRIRIWKSA